MTTWATVRSDIWTWINGILNPTGGTIPVIWADDNGPRPAFPYVSLNKISDRYPGLPYAAPVVLSNPGDPTSGTQTLYREEEFVLSIQAFGVGSDDLLEALRTGAEIEDNIASLVGAGYTTRGAGPTIRDISQTLDDSREKRFVMDMTFGFTQQIIPPEGYWIETVDWTGVFAVYESGEPNINVVGTATD